VEEQDNKLRTFSEIANELGITRQTLWVKTRHVLPLLRNGSQRKRLYNAAERDIILEAIGIVK